MTFQILELELPVGSGSENSSTASTAISYVMTFSEFFHRFWIRMYFREFNPGGMFAGIQSQGVEYGSVTRGQNMFTLQLLKNAITSCYVWYSSVFFNFR